MSPIDFANMPHDCADAIALARLLQTGDVDAALAGGLMTFVPCPTCAAPSTANLHEFQQRIAKAWAARDRYLARTTRLARLAAARDARRAGVKIEKKSTLPPSVAAILARAKAKAAQSGP